MIRERKQESNMKLVMSIVALTVLAAAPAAAQQTRLYDDRGNSLGTSNPTSPNSNRYYDSRGNTLGTSTTDSQGTTTFYDSRGKVTGRSTR